MECRDKPCIEKYRTLWMAEIMASFMVLGWSFVVRGVDSTSIVNWFCSNMIPLTFYFAVGCVATWHR
jgi:hypothetical protein